MLSREELKRMKRTELQRLSKVSYNIVCSAHMLIKYTVLRYPGQLEDGRIG